MPGSSFQVAKKKTVWTKQHIYFTFCFYKRPKEDGGSFNKGFLLFVSAKQAHVIREKANQRLPARDLGGVIWKVQQNHCGARGGRGTRQLAAGWKAYLAARNPAAGRRGCGRRSWYCKQDAIPGWLGTPIGAAILKSGGRGQTYGGSCLGQVRALLWTGQGQRAASRPRRRPNWADPNVFAGNEEFTRCRACWNRTRSAENRASRNGYDWNMQEYADICDTWTVYATTCTNMQIICTDMQKQMFLPAFNNNNAIYYAKICKTRQKKSNYTQKYRLYYCKCNFAQFMCTKMQIMRTTMQYICIKHALDIH